MATYVQLAVDEAPCRVDGGLPGMAAQVAAGLGAPSSAVKTVDVREVPARGGALVTVEIFAPYVNVEDPDHG